MALAAMIVGEVIVAAMGLLVNSGRCRMAIRRVRAMAQKDVTARSGIVRMGRVSSARAVGKAMAARVVRMVSVVPMSVATGMVRAGENHDSVRMQRQIVREGDPLGVILMATASRAVEEMTMREARNTAAAESLSGNQVTARAGTVTMLGDLADVMAASPDRALASSRVGMVRNVVEDQSHAVAMAVADRVAGSRGAVADLRDQVPKGPAVPRADHFVRISFPARVMRKL